VIPLLLAALAGGDEPAKSVLFVTWDTTRADRVGCYGWKNATTPTLDGLAARGVLYERAWSAAPITLPSHTTMFTGVYPCAHGVRDNAAFHVAPSARLLAEALRDAGFKTAAFVGSFILDPKFGLDQGFDVYDAPDASTEGLGWSVIERPAGVVADAALKWIDQRKSDERLFLWVHFYDPHSPHECDPKSLAPGQDAYDGEIAECDRQLARILDRLHTRGLDERLLTIVASDHGESHGEHGEATHACFLYDATMRVPLVVAPPPKGVAAGFRSKATVSTADLAATVVTRVGLDRSTMPDAKTAVLPSADPEEDDRALYLETFFPFYAHRWHPLRAVVWRQTKYVDAPKPELYDLDRDPHELVNLAESKPELRERFAQRLASLEKEQPELKWQTDGVITSEDASKLGHLGYSSAATSGDPFDARLQDPKDRIGDLAVLEEVEQGLHDANVLLGLGRAVRTGRRPDVPPEREERAKKVLGAAREKAEALHAANPLDPGLDSILATIDLDLRNFAAAVAPLERAVHTNPHNVPLRYNLAVAYSMTDRAEWACREMEKAIAVEPRSLLAHRWLLQVKVSAKDWAAAAYWIDRLAKLPGQNRQELANVEAGRQRIASELAKVHGTPRAPEPVTEADLEPEGLRHAADPKSESPAPKPPPKSESKQ
jgi:arylsulfatase A-like enzyme